MAVTRLRAIIIVLVLLSSSFALLASGLTVVEWKASSSGMMSTILPLHVDGRWIKDSNGNIVILRGVNGPNYVDRTRGNWFVPGTTRVQNTWNENNAVKANLDAQSSWGSNVNRIFFPLSYWKFNKNNFRQNIKDHISWAGSRDIYVIFGPYQVLGYIDEGGRRDELPYPPYQTGSEADTTLALQTVSNIQDFIDIWVTIANELKDYPNVIFEIWNEPHTPAARSEWFQVVKDSIKAIRATGSLNVIVVQWDYDIWHNTAGGHNDLSWIDDWGITDPNILYSTHVYIESMWGQGSIPMNVTINDVRQLYSDCLLDAYSQKVPIIIGETNVLTSAGSAGTNAFNQSLFLWNEWQIGYIGWIWAHSVSYPLLQPTTYIPPPTSNGQVLVDAISSAPPKPEELTALIQQTSNQISLGQDVTFTVSVSKGAAPYSYQWYLDNVIVQSANTSSWVLTPSAQGLYSIYVDVQDSTNSISRSQTVNVVAS